MVSGAGASVAAKCPPTAVGIDTTVAGFAEYENLGSAMGETFVARETLITSITFWRPTTDFDATCGFKLYVVGTDASGTPNTADVILAGSVVDNVLGDGVHPIPMKFEFSPPLVLPHAGTYEAAIGAYPCSCASKYLRTLDDEYPEGIMWSHSETSPCSLRSGPGAVPSLDLFFRVEFCGAITPARAATWGEVKDVYR
jgi:hypothetical protein